MSNEKHRVLVIGSGSIGTRHLRLTHEMGHAVCACDTDTAAFDRIREDIPDIETFDDLDRALASGPDLVIVATPHSSHAALTVAALESGAHVFCEKPMADTLEGADDMIAAADRTGRVLHIGFVFRFHPCLVRLKEIVESGRIGTPVFGQASLGSYRTLVCSRTRHQEHVYAALLLDYTHQLDFIPWLLASPAQRVYAVGRTKGQFELKSSPNVICLTLEHADDVLSDIHLDYCRNPQVNTLTVTGDRGYVACDLMAATLDIGMREEETLEREAFELDYDDVYREQLRNVFAAMEGRPARLCSGAEGRRSLEIVTAAMASLDSGAAEPVQTDG